ncbi:MAG: phage protein [Pseudomonadales bacterium]
MGALKVYNPKEVVFIFDGIPLESGIIDGSFITLSRVSRNASINVGADGGGTLVRINDKSVTVTLSLRKGTNTNDKLMDIIAAEEAIDGQKRVGPVTIEDFSGRSLSFGQEGFLDGPPDDEFSNDEGEVTWTWMVLEMEVDVRGSSDAASAFAGAV